MPIHHVTEQLSKSDVTFTVHPHSALNHWRPSTRCVIVDKMEEETLQEVWILESKSLCTFNSLIYDLLRYELINCYLTGRRFCVRIFCKASQTRSVQGRVPAVLPLPTLDNIYIDDARINHCNERRQWRLFLRRQNLNNTARILHQTLDCFRGYFRKTRADCNIYSQTWRL